MPDLPQPGDVWTPEGDETREVVEVDETHVVFHAHGGTDFATHEEWLRWVRERKAVRT